MSTLPASVRAERQEQVLLLWQPTQTEAYTRPKGTRNARGHLSMTAKLPCLSALQ